MLVAGYKPPWSSGLGLRGTAAELASGLRLARSEAILRNRPVAFELDVTGRRYRVGSGNERRLPRASVDRAADDRRRTARGLASGDIRFNPDGSSTGGRISLADGRQKMAVGVDWLTGRVSVADVQ